jgi:hypothetical protein
LRGNGLQRTVTAVCTWLWEGVYHALKEIVCDTKEVSVVELQQNAGKIIEAVRRRFDDRHGRGFEKVGFKANGKVTEQNMILRHVELRQIFLEAVPLIRDPLISFRLGYSVKELKKNWRLPLHVLGSVTNHLQLQFVKAVQKVQNEHVTV